MKTITLTEPLVRRAKSNGEVLDTVETVTVRRPKSGDLFSALDASGGGQLAGSFLRALASRLTRLSIAELDELAIEDTAALLEAVQDFLPAGLTTGVIGSSSSQAPTATPPISANGEHPSSNFGQTPPSDGSAA